MAEVNLDRRRKEEGKEEVERREVLGFNNGVLQREEERSELVKFAHR